MKTSRLFSVPPVLRSRFLPRILRLWLMLNCFAYLATSLTGMLWPQYEQKVSSWVFLVVFGELVTMLWLIIMSAKERRPKTAALLIRPG